MAKNNEGPMSTQEVSVKVPISDEFIKDVMVTMVESGYDSMFYWAVPVAIERDSDSYPHTIALMEAEEMDVNDDPEEPAPVHTLTRDMVVPAIQKIIDNTLLGSSYMHYLMRGITDNDAGDIDATIADAILQVALLGEVRYG